MEVPKICYNKFLWTAVVASFTFTGFMYQTQTTNAEQVAEEVKTNYNYNVARVDANLSDLNNKVAKINEDTQYIKGKLDILTKKP